jgi:hypothetical protein
MRWSKSWAGWRNTGLASFNNPRPHAEAMSERPIVKVLFIEDDEEDFILTNDLLREIRTARY